MNIIKPANLKKGDTIGILATSGPIKQDSLPILTAVDYLKQSGYQTVISNDIYKEDRYLAGEDETRLKDLHDFFKNPHINAIICLRGGYGALRLINRIDYSIIRNNPKIFIGSSDATAFLATFYAQANLVSFHSLMLLNGFSKNDIDLINNQKEILPKKKHKIFIDGEAQGVLWGGNLSTIVSLFGSCNYLPDKEIILFLEDINEPLYKIDKMLIQIFRNLQLKNKIKGIVFGEFLGLKKEEEKQLENLLFEYSKMLNIPCVYGYDITHGKNNVTVPFGRCAKLFGAKICLL